jgi:2-isopropylmalate synthase
VRRVVHLRVVIVRECYFFTPSFDMSSKPKIQIYDTTLRDGTQGEGVSFSVSAKLRVTEKLDQFGIDYIEGGWPGSNPRDMAYFEAVRDLKLQHAKVAAFGSTRRANVKVEEDVQIQLLLDADTPVVTIFGKSWGLHVTEVIRTTLEENLSMIEDSVRYLKSKDKEVVYDAEHFFDGYFTDAEYAIKTLDAAVAGGADWLVLCDSNGGKLTAQAGDITQTIINRFPEHQVGVHCHNDIGLGVATSLAGVESGATMVQGTINGYGERNGNANLTSIIPSLILKMGLDTSCSTQLESLRDLSLYVDDVANLRPDSRAPYVGASSFAHKGGIHADATAKVSHSYEHMEPERVGNRRRILVSDLSGRSSIMMKARQIGIDVDSRSPEMKDFLEELKDLEFKGYEYEAADASFKLLLNKFLKGVDNTFELLDYRVSVQRDNETGKMGSEATVKLRAGNEVTHAFAESNGPVGALDHALRKALKKTSPDVDHVKLTDFKVRILEGGIGTDSKIRVMIESTDGKEIWGTVGASDNVIDATWVALRDAFEYKIQMLGEE